MARPRRRNKMPEEVYAETVEQIEIARRRKSDSLILGKGRRGLELIPPLDDLPYLAHVNLSGTGVLDITQLILLPQLKTLTLGNPDFRDLAPAIALQKLERLNLERSNVSNLSPLTGLKGLESLSIAESPVSDIEPIGRLMNLKRLSLRDCAIADISPLARLDRLESLYLERCPVDSLAPLKKLEHLRFLSLGLLETSPSYEPLTGMVSLRKLQVTGQFPIDLSFVTSLKDLESLVITRSQISLLPSLAELQKLELVSFYGTNIENLEPLASCSNLKTLNLRRTKVSDVSQVARFSLLEDLALDQSQVSDLSPAAGLLSLIEGAKRSAWEGLSFIGCPITDRTLLEFAKARNPDRTIDTLNYLRSKEGLPEIVAFPLDEPIADWRSRALNFDQNPLGVRFEAADDHFAIAPSGQQSDLDAAKQPITRQLHEQVKAKSVELCARAARLANTTEWQGLSKSAVSFNELIQEDSEAIAENVGLLWAELVSIGTFVEQDDDLRAEPGTFASPLDADVRRPLVDFIQTAGPWIRRFPSARELDNDHAAFHAPRTAVQPAIQIIDAADEGAVIEGDDARILGEALRSGSRSGVQSEKARSWGVLSVRNLIVGAIGIAALNVSAGSLKEIGVEVAKNSRLAHKSIRLILSTEEALLQFLTSLPADIRSTVRALINDLKGSDAQFPLPQPPREEPVQTRRRRTEED